LWPTSLDSLFDVLVDGALVILAWSSTGSRAEGHCNDWSGAVDPQRSCKCDALPCLPRVMGWFAPVNAGLISRFANLGAEGATRGRPTQLIFI